MKWILMGDLKRYANYARNRAPALKFHGVIQRIKREVVVWQASRHANILEFYGFKIVGHGDALFVSPWCANGNLRQYTKKHPELSRRERLKLVSEVLPRS